MTRFLRIWPLPAILLAAVSFITTESIADDTGQAEGTKKIVLIGHEPDHPYRTHCYLPDCELLARCLRQTEGVEAVVSRNWPTDPEVLRGVDAIVLHVREGGTLLFHPPHRDEAARLLKEGVGLAAIHWGTGAAMGEVGARWLAALGGWFNPEFSRYLVQESTVRVAEPGHPVSRGWNDYPLRDEFYIKLRFQPEAKPVMVANVDGDDYPIGWVYERPDSAGRSFGFVGGHFHDNFAVEEFRRGIVNGILWTAGVELPAGGAPCEIGPQDLELTPEFEALRPKQ